MALMFLCIALALGLSFAVPVMKYAMAGDSSWLPSALVYFFVWVGGVWIVRRVPVQRERTGITVVIIASSVLKVGMALVVPALPLNTDQEILRYFMEHLVSAGMSDPAMNQLAQTNDYASWVSRAFPAHYLIRLMGGGEYLPVLRAANIAASTATLMLVCWLAFQFLPSGRRLMAVWFFAALPFQTWIVTDHSHHLFSSLYLLAGTCCVIGIRMRTNSDRIAVFLSLAAGCLLIAIVMQRGLHMIALAGWFMIAVMPGGDAWSGRRVLRNMSLIFIIPAAIALPVTKYLDAWFARYAPGDFGSALPGFVARGWCPQTGGEYTRRYEQIEKSTPAPERALTMFRMVGSQIKHHPVDSIVTLPVIKTAKLFLVGYASNIEESLQMMQSAKLPFVRGLRMAATILFLSAVLFGLYRLLRANDRDAAFSFPLLVIPALVWFAYGVMGETSPRYSIFAQAFLAVAGARSFGSKNQAVDSTLHGNRYALRWVAGIALFVVTVFAAVALVVRGIPADRFYADLSKGWMKMDHVSEGELPPFEIRLRPSRDAEAAEWAIPDDIVNPSQGSFYLLGVTPGIRDGRLQIISGQGSVLADEDLNSWNQTKRIDFTIPGGTRSLNIGIRVPNHDGSSDECVDIGYLRMF